MNDYIEKIIETNMKKFIDDNRLDEFGFIKISIRDINTIAYLSALEGYRLGCETAKNIYDNKKE